MEVLHLLKSGWSLKTLGPKEQVEGREGCILGQVQRSPVGSLSLSGSVSLPHSPLHPHFSGCLGKSTIPAALLNNASVFKVPLLTTSLCQKQHACCVCLWKPPALGDMCTHSAVVSISLHLFLCHSHCCVQHFVLLLYKNTNTIFFLKRGNERAEAEVSSV